MLLRGSRRWGSYPPPFSRSGLVHPPRHLWIVDRLLAVRLGAPPSSIAEASVRLGCGGAMLWLRANGPTIMNPP